MSGKISILGCGWFGLAFGKLLTAKGFQVKGSTTSEHKLALLAENKIQPFLINILHPETYGGDHLFFDCDILIITVPHTRNNKQVTNYTSLIRTLMDAITRYSVAKIILISSTGVYGANVTAVDESTLPIPGSSPVQTLLDIEGLFANETAFQTTIVRFAGLVGPGRHPGRFLAGKANVENGLAPVNLLHLDDAMGICMAIIDKNLFGLLVNACCPDHPSRQEFYTLAALKGGNVPPVFLPATTYMKKVNSIVVAETLEYQFTITSWLKWLEL